MHGPEILARSITPIRPFGEKGYRGQYHQQSDHHSKVVSWSILYDLLIESPLLQKHVAEGKVIAGVNHRMSDFAMGRDKSLDLVIARPREEGRSRRRTFQQLARHWMIDLSDSEATILGELPTLVEGPVGSVLVAVEAKATMTAHQKALPRLYDELNSSQATVHGAADQAVAAAAVIVNHSQDFLTYDLNKKGVDSADLVMTDHSQPRDVELVIDKVRQLPRRSGTGSYGFDALGIIVIECRNEGSPVKVVMAAPAPGASSDYHYDQMIRRVAAHYDFRFSQI